MVVVTERLRGPNCHGAGVSRDGDGAGPVGAGAGQQAVRGVGEKRRFVDITGQYGHGVSRRGFQKLTRYHRSSCAPPALHCLLCVHALCVRCASPAGAGVSLHVLQ